MCVNYECKKAEKVQTMQGIYSPGSPSLFFSLSTSICLSLWGKVPNGRCTQVYKMTTKLRLRERTQNRFLSSQHVIRLVFSRWLSPWCWVELQVQETRAPRVRQPQGTPDKKLKAIPRCRVSALNSRASILMPKWPESVLRAPWQVPITQAKQDVGMTREIHKFKQLVSSILQEFSLNQLESRLLFGGIQVFNKIFLQFIDSTQNPSINAPAAKVHNGNIFMITQHTLDSQAL